MGTFVLLAIETSQRQGGVAVRDDRGRVHAEPLAVAVRPDDDLLPAIDRLYARLGLEPKSTEVVGVSIGPGGFTGLRIAVSTAKMFAEALGAKIIAVPTALVVAEAYQQAGPIIVALASKGQTVWATRLDRVDGVWRIIDDGRLIEAESLALEEVHALLGDAYLPEALRAKCQEAGVRIVAPTFDPLSCLAVAQRSWGQGDTTDPLALAPLYARPAGAVPRRRQAAVARGRYGPT